MLAVAFFIHVLSKEGTSAGVDKARSGVGSARPSRVRVAVYQMPAVSSATSLGSTSMDRLMPVACSMAKACLGGT